VLTQVNTAVLRCGQRTFCTALYCELVPHADGVQFKVAAGGHPLPIVQRAHGKSETFGEPGTLLGLFEESRSTTSSTVLMPDDFVVLYTDGVTDLPPPHALTPDDVCDIIDESLADAATADELAAALGRALEERIPFAERDDDIALLVLRVVAARPA
jgi:serine phosphatase RsbU (regulator of sigma subunit)